jgi:hypothetical protein
MPSLTESQIAWLVQRGFIVGARDPLRNTAFRGAYMVAEPCDPVLLPTEAADVGGYCVVGDCLAAIVRDAFNFFYDPTNEETAHVK